MKYDKLLRKIREYDIDDIADVDAIRNRYETEILVLSGNSSNVNLYFNFSQSEIITLEGNGYIIDGAKNVLFKECNSGINIITFKSTGFAKIKISDRRYVLSLGDESNYFNDNSNYLFQINFDQFPNVTKINLQYYCNLLGALPSDLIFLELVGDNINWTYEEELPSSLIYLKLNGNNINWTYKGELSTNLIYLELIGNNINWTYEGTLSSYITYLYLAGENINWMFVPWSFAENFQNYSIYTIGILHSIENITSVLNKGAQVTWAGDKIINLENQESMADTTQGGIWGDFSDINNFQPSQLAMDLKTLVKDKGVTVSLKDIVIPGELDDGEGFPVNFGAWWNENYIGILTYNNSPASLYFNFSDTTQVALSGDGYLYDNVECTTNPEKTKTYTSGLKYVYFKTDSISTIRINNKSNVIGLGSEDIYFNSNTNYKLKINSDYFLNATKIRLQYYCNLVGTLPNGLTYLYLSGANIHWTYEGAMPNGLTYLYLYGANIHWTYTSWNFANNFRYYAIYVIGILHTRENIISVLNKGAQVTWTNEKQIYLLNHASMADTTQGGIWGNFSNIENFQPSQVAIDLKTLVKVKNVTVTLNGISMPGATGDGTGFPQNFGTWWRS